MKMFMCQKAPDAPPVPRWRGDLVWRALSTLAHTGSQGFAHTVPTTLPSSLWGLSGLGCSGFGCSGFGCSGHCRRRLTAVSFALGLAAEAGSLTDLASLHQAPQGWEGTGTAACPLLGWGQTLPAVAPLPALGVALRPAAAVCSSVPTAAPSHAHPPLLFSVVRAVGGRGFFWVRRGEARTAALPEQRAPGSETWGGGAPSLQRAHSHPAAARGRAVLSPEVSQTLSFLFFHCASAASARHSTNPAPRRSCPCPDTQHTPSHFPAPLNFSRLTSL